MKSLIVILTLVFTLFLLQISAANTPEFYSEYHQTVNIEKTELRALKLLELLDKYPGCAGDVRSLFNETFHALKVTPEHSNKAAALLKKYPHDLMLNSIITSFFPLRSADYAEHIRNLLLNCKNSNLSQHEEFALVQFWAQLFLHWYQTGRCYENIHVADTFFSRFDLNHATASLRFLLLERKLDFYLAAIWEKHCTAPNFKSWKNLPDKGVKSRYLQTVNALPELEKILEYPFSRELLKLYNRHHIPRNTVYAATFDGTLDTELFNAALGAAILSGKPEIFEPYLSKISSQEILGEIAVWNANNFQNFDWLAKFAPPVEVELARAVIKKDFTKADRTARKITGSGKITFPGTIYFFVDLIWKTRDKALLQKLWNIAEKNPDSLLTPDLANSIAYTAATLNVNLDKARILAFDAWKKYPASSAVIDTCAYICYRQNDLASAHQLITLAMQYISPGDGCAPIYLHAAEIEFARTKDKARTRHLLERALKCAAEDKSEFNSARAAELQEMLK